MADLRKIRLVIVYYILSMQPYKLQL